VRCAPEGWGTALTQPTLPFLVYLRERMGKRADGRAKVIHLAPHEPGRARPCRIERAEVPGLGPSTRRRGSNQLPAAFSMG